VPLPPLLVLTVRLDQVERNQEDLALLERIKRRDELALGKLYDRYAQLLYTLAYRIVTTAEEAEDVLQEAFVHVWNRSNAYLKERGTVYSWMVTITRNKAIDRVRSKRFKQQSKEVKATDAGHRPDSHSLSPPQTVALKEYQTIVVAAHQKLSSVESKILDLSYFGGYSQTEIAKILKMPIGTVKTKMRQGITKLRQAINPAGLPR
jgi:RNA polymerase sigma-70 factor (ECF subfamily)